MPKLEPAPNEAQGDIIGFHISGLTITDGLGQIIKAFYDANPNGGPINLTINPWRDNVSEPSPLLITPVSKALPQARPRPPALPAKRGRQKGGNTLAIYAALLAHYPQPISRRELVNAAGVPLKPCDQAILNMRKNDLLAQSEPGHYVLSQHGYATLTARGQAS